MANANLMMYGKDTTRVERPALSMVKMPEATRSYTPVRHDDLLELTQQKLFEAGYTFGDEVHHLARNGKRYFGMVNLHFKSMSSEIALILGIRNSLDQSIAGSILLGNSVFMCDNLCWSADIYAIRKHTTFIMRDLPEMIEGAVAKTEGFVKLTEMRYGRYQDIRLTDSEADRLIVQMVRQNAVNTSRIGKVIQEWYDPKAANEDGVVYDHGPKRVWRLFNAATEALKGAPVTDMPLRSMRLQQIMDDAAGFDPNFNQQRLVA